MCSYLGQTNLTMPRIYMNKPLSTTSSTEVLLVAAMTPRIEKMTNPLKILVSKSRNATTNASLKWTVSPIKSFQDIDRKMLKQNLLPKKFLHIVNPFFCLSSGLVFLHCSQLSDVKSEGANTADDKFNGQRLNRPYHQLNRGVCNITEMN